MTTHRCSWPGCTEMVEPALWGCKSHWFKLPIKLRKELWRTYVPGQTASTASPEYVAAARAIQAWIAKPAGSYRR